MWGASPDSSRDAAFRPVYNVLPAVNDPRIVLIPSILPKVKALWHDSR
jgi:hypothetical protein